MSAKRSLKIFSSVCGHEHSNTWYFTAAVFCRCHALLDFLHHVAVWISHISPALIHSLYFSTDVLVVMNTVTHDTLQLLYFVDTMHYCTSYIM